jgi:uncharacterized membrane protein
MRWLDAHFWPLLAAGTVLYALIFGVAALYKYHSFWMGFDLGVHEQLLWNTIHGHLAEISPKGATRSYLGVDIIITELLLAPLYWLVPHTETLLLTQVAVAASGTIPLALLARDRAGEGAARATWGLFAAFLYAASLPIQYAILYEFQIRTIGTVLFLWAFLFFERKQFWPFLVAGVLAIWTRSDGSFALAAMGLYALIHRRAWPWVVVPGVVGIGWLMLCLKLLIPAFRDDNGFLYGFVYAWLGEGPFEMVRTMLLRPAYVLEQVVTAGKLRYLLELFAPLLFLPLLRPDILMLAMPSLLLNLLSPEHIHWSVRYHYQAFIIPFLLIAVVYALIPARPAEKQTEEQSLTPLLSLPRERGNRVSGGGEGNNTRFLGLWLCRFSTWRPALATLLVGVALLSQVVLIRSPLIHLATRPRDNERIALARQVMALVPPDAPLTATSAFGAHLARRHELYFFPGNIIYPPELAERGEYLLADLREVPPEAMGQLHAMQESESWRVQFEQGGFLLLVRGTGNGDREQETGSDE